MPISVLLVDDHELFRASVREILETTTNFLIVGETGDGMEALVLAERLQPDVVVLDYMMPDMCGEVVAWWLRKMKKGGGVIILSMYDDESYVINSIQNGAKGYVLKEDVATDLAKAVNAVVANQYYFSPTLRERIPLLEQSIFKNQNEGLQ